MQAQTSTALSFLALFGGAELAADRVFFDVELRRNFSKLCRYENRAYWHGAKP